jgi:hypothetical protein
MATDQFGVLKGRMCGCRALLQEKWTDHVVWVIPAQVLILLMLAML